MTEKYVVIPDIQAPFHDRKALEAILDFIRFTKPDGVLCVGDEIDLPSVSRWEKGKKIEFTQSLTRDIRITHEIFEAVRAIVPRRKPIHISRSNHGDRLENYVQRHAPALWEFVEPGGLLDIPTLVGYDQLGIDFHRKPFEFTPGWVLCHGDEGSLSPLAGRTATNLAVNKFGKSVVCGHTHRLGVSNHTVGLDGRQNVLTGIEVGHVMDVKKASYMASGSANWQQGCGLVEANGRKTAAVALPIIDGKVVAP